MLYRLPIQDVKAGTVTRRQGHLAVVMQYYPRFLSKDLVDEYVKALAPDKALFTEFKSLDRSLGSHEDAFQQVRYEERFTLSPEGWAALERISHAAYERDAFLICQCALSERCHGDLLLLAARKRYGAAIPAPRLRYPIFEARLGVEE